MSGPMYPEWFKYWKDIEPKLAKHVEKSRIPEVDRFLEHSFALFSFLTEGLDKKTIRNDHLQSKLLVMIVETQDLMRGIIACYRDLTLAPLGLLLRTSFEILCTMKYIVRSPDAETLANLFDRFAEIEKLSGLKGNPRLQGPTAEQWNAAQKTHPEWFERDKKGNLQLQKNLHWTSKGKSLRDLAAAPHVQLEADYILVYKTNSKFTHGSPLIANMYRKVHGLHAIPEAPQSVMLAVPAIINCLATLEEFYWFLGIEWPRLEAGLMQFELLEIREILGGFSNSEEKAQHDAQMAKLRKYYNAIMVERGLK